MGVQANSLIVKTLAESRASLAAKLAVVLHAKNFLQETDEKTADFVNKFLANPQNFIQEHGSSFSIGRTYKLLQLAAQGTKADLSRSLPEGISEKPMQAAINAVYSPKRVTPLRVAMAVFAAAAFTAGAALRANSQPQARALVAVPQLPTCPVPLVAPKASELVPHGFVTLPSAMPPLELPSDSFLRPVQGCDRFPREMTVEKPGVKLSQQPTIRELAMVAVDATREGFEKLGSSAIKGLDYLTDALIVEPALDLGDKVHYSVGTSATGKLVNSGSEGQLAKGVQAAFRNVCELGERVEQKLKPENLERQAKKIGNAVRDFVWNKWGALRYSWRLDQLEKAARKAGDFAVTTVFPKTIEIAETTAQRIKQIAEERRSEIEKEVATGLDRLPNMTAKALKIVRDFSTAYTQRRDATLQSLRDLAQPVRDRLGIPSWIMRGNPDYAEWSRQKQLAERNANAGAKIRELDQLQANKKATAAYHNAPGNIRQGVKLERQKR